jgi:hypothetical protein
MPDITYGDNKVNSESTLLGNTKFASNVKILDLREGDYIPVYPIRLADATLYEGMITYSQLNNDREITELILNGATGDLDEYGIFTGYTYAGNSGTYNYIVNGIEGKFTMNTFTNLNTTKGPTGFQYEGSNITASYQLKEISVTSIGNTTITAGGTKYPLAEKVGVYYLTDTKYVATTIDKISDLSKYNVTAYYDKAISLGGRIRVIVAETIN